MAVLRGQAHFAKRISEPPSENASSVSKRQKLIDANESLKIVGSSTHQRLETSNGRVRKMASDPYEEYCKEMTPECIQVLFFVYPFLFGNFINRHLFDVDKCCRRIQRRHLLKSRST